MNGQTPRSTTRRAITIAAIALAVTAIAAPAASARFDPGTQQPSSGPQTQSVPVAPPILQPAKTPQLAAFERAKLQALANHVPPYAREGKPRARAGEHRPPSLGANPGHQPMTAIRTRRAAATILSAALALTALTAPALARPIERPARPPADQRPMRTTAPVTRPTTPTHAPRLAHGSDLERACLTFVGGVSLPR